MLHIQVRLVGYAIVRWTTLQQAARVRELRSAGKFAKELYMPYIRGYQFCLTDVDA